MRDAAKPLHPWIASRLLWRSYASTDLANRILAVLRPFIARFDRLLPYVPDRARVFDIGCGNGLLLILLHDRGRLLRGAGVDIDTATIAAARRAADANHAPIQFRRATTPLDWPTEEFDAVLMVDVLHHVPRALRRQLVEAALGRVTLGGLFIYKDMCRRPVLRRVWNQLHDLVLARQLVRVEPIEHVLEWVLAAGLIPVASERYVGAGLYGHELEVFRRSGF